MKKTKQKQQQKRTNKQTKANNEKLFFDVPAYEVL